MNDLFGKIVGSIMFILLFATSLYTIYFFIMNFEKAIRGIVSMILGY
jgi:hypothetical protein